jgi:hypothetical protein
MEATEGPMLTFPMAEIENVLHFLMGIITKGREQPGKFRLAVNESKLCLCLGLDGPAT